MKPRLAGRSRTTDDKPLLLKTTPTQLIEYGEVKLVLTQKLHAYRLMFTVLEAGRTMATTPDAAFETLMNGVTSWDLPKEFIPSELLLIGEAAFPVMVNDKGQVLIAASSYGQGRLVVISHESYLLHAGFTPFLLNAVSWLCPSPGAPIAVHSSVASLVNILDASGMEALVQSEPGEALGVYCTDAYNDSLTEKLVQFVKRGGGLLIGGQAWYWASQHGSDKVLSSFPGNQVTSVAGVYFTDVCGDRDWFKVSKEIPNFTLYVECKDELKYDQQQLLEGISEMDIETGAVPSQLLVHGQRAFPLGVDDSFNCFLAAAHYGRGCVVLGGHESLMLNQKMLPFVLNALHWLMGHKTGRIGLASEMRALKSMLPKSGFQWTETEFLISDLSVFCCCSFTDTDAKKVQEFVAEGGGLLIGAKAWLRGGRSTASNCMTEYPNNIILKCFGLGIINQVVDRGSFPVPNSKVINYHIRRALAQFESTIYSQNSLQERWLGKLLKDCSYMFQMTHQRISTYDSVKKHALEIIQNRGFPSMSEKHPIIKGSSEAFLLFLVYELFKSGVDVSQLLPSPSLLPPTETPVAIKISKGDRNSWVSTGLYLPEGQVAQITLPSEAMHANLKVLIGCHTDNISKAKVYHRPPVMTHTYHLDSSEKSISWIYGGLLYIMVPHKYNQDDMCVTISGAVSAPYFRVGFLHSGYPIMGYTRIAKSIIDEVTIRSHGTWGVMHELGHNQQKSKWSFHPHTNEALCNLWAVYVHETVLNIHREQAHHALNPELRKKRIKDHLSKGAPLSNWVVWTALETYLQKLLKSGDLTEELSSVGSIGRIFVLVLKFMHRYHLSEQLEWSRFVLLPTLLKEAPIAVTVHHARKIAAAGAWGELVTPHLQSEERRACSDGLYSYGRLNFVNGLFCIYWDERMASASALRSVY
ncbi:hypothetical protein STEG23_027012 [Scotinomys teguina]